MTEENSKSHSVLDELSEREGFKRFEKTTDPFSDLVCLRDLRASVEKEGRKDLAEALGWEIQAHELMLRSWRHGGKNVHALLPISEGRDREGRRVVAPDLQKFSPEMLLYFRTRSDRTVNPILTARFGDILWTKQKDHKAADKAIDAYLESAAEFLDKGDYVEFTNRFGRATSIAVEANSASWGQKLIERARSYLDRLASKKEYRWVMEVLFDLVGFPKEWMKDHYDHVIERADRGYQWSNPKHPTADLSFADYLKIKEMAYKRQGSKAKAEHCRVQEAQCYERLGLDAMNSKEYMKASTHFQTCLQKYISLGQRSDKVDEIKRLFKECNEKARRYEFQTTTTEVEIPREEIDRLLHSLKEKSVDEILAFVAAEQTFLCPVQEAQKQAKAGIEAAPLLHMVKNVVQDARGNVVEVLDTAEKKFTHSLYEVMSFHYQFKALHFLMPIFDLIRTRGEKRTFWGLLENCLRYSFDSVRGYRAQRKLRAYSSVPSGRAARRDTASKLAGFFAQFDFFEGDNLLFLENGFERYLEEDYVGSVHVLTFRIEAVLRRVLDRLGVPTSSTRDGKTQEKNLEGILEEPKLLSALGEDIATFLKWLLIAKLGFNLRHSVAHGLLPCKAFSKLPNALLMYALLLFTRFSFQQKGDAQDDQEGPNE